MKLSLAMIALNCAKTIGDTIRSVSPIVDEVVVVDTGSTDGTPAAVLAARPDAKVVTYLDPNRHPVHGWTSDFAAIRNKSLDACTGDAILWLDSDDVVHNPALLRQWIEKMMVAHDPPCDILNVRYDYAFDENGVCTIRQPRYRVVRRGCVSWEYPVHEDVRPLRPVKMGDLQKIDTYVIHKRDGSGDGNAAARNLWIMEQYQQRGGEMNDRLWQNVGSSLSLLGRWEEALAAFDRSLEMAGHNPETDYITRLRRADCNRSLKRWSAAQDECLQAIKLFPDRAVPYIAAGEMALNLGKHGQAMVWAALSEQVGGDAEGVAWNPHATALVPTEIRAKALMALDDIPGSLAEYEKLVKALPKHAEIRSCRDALKEIVDNHALYENLMAVHRALEGQPDAQQKLLESAPSQLRTFPAVARAMRPARPEGVPVLAIYCGPSGVPWGPQSVDKGVGGSEEAVVFLSREIAAQGYHVEVYAFPPPDQMGTDAHGVVWLPYYAMDPADAPDVYVSWRQWRGDDRCPNAGQRWLWLHDAIQPSWFAPDLMAGWDGIWTLTEWHRNGIPEPVRAKALLTKNGLNQDYLLDGPNKASRFIYASSPDRGLLQVLEAWPQIKAAIPDATLDIFYGYTANYLSDMQRIPHLRALKDRLDVLVKQPGVFWRGMVGQMELASAFAQSGFWLYPTSWPETSCITAMKAQALGCIPITSRFRASGVPETTQYDLGPAARDGTIESDPAWLADWVAAVKAAHARTDLDHYRALMKAWARETFSWRKVAEQWASEFKARSSGTCPSSRRGLTLLPAVT